jgi:hypothetical protein
MCSPLWTRRSCLRWGFNRIVRERERSAEIRANPIALRGSTVSTYVIYGRGNGHKKVERKSRFLHVTHKSLTRFLVTISLIKIFM